MAVSAIKYVKNSRDCSWSSDQITHRRTPNTGLDKYNFSLTIHTEQQRSDLFDFMDNCKCTTLHPSSQNRQHYIVKTLICVAEINFRVVSSLTRLQLASTQTNNVAIATLLLQNEEARSIRLIQTRKL